MEKYSKNIKPKNIDAGELDLFNDKKVDEQIEKSSNVLSDENKEVEGDGYKKLTQQELDNLATEDPVLHHAITEAIQNSVEEERKQNEIEDRDEEEQMRSLRESINKAIQEKDSKNDDDKDDQSWDLYGRFRK